MTVAEDVSVRPVITDRVDDWHRVVDDHPCATAFHSLAWRDAVAGTFGYRSDHRLVYVEGIPVGAIPCFEMDKFVRSIRVNPFCAYGFPLVTDDGDTSTVIRALAEDRTRLETLLIKEADWTGTAGYSPSGFGGRGTGITRRLETTIPYDRLLHTVFDRRLRSHIERTDGDRVSIDRVTKPSAVLDDLYELHRKTMRRQGSPQFPRAFFDALVDAFGDGTALFVARRSGRIVGSLLGFDHAGTRFLWNNSSDADHWDTSPNHRLYARAVRDACQRDDCQVIDFGRTERDSGVDEFKAQFGAEPIPLTTMVMPPTRALAADLSGYRRLAPLTRRLAPVVTHPLIGPRLKEWVHE